MQSILDLFDRHPMAGLALGAALLAATHFHWAVDALAWFPWVPVLRYLRLRGGIRSWFAAVMVVMVVMVAMTVGVAKIIMGLVPLVMAVAFGAPIGFSLSVPAVGFAVIRSVLEERCGPSWHGPTALLFPAFMVVGELCQHVLLGSSVSGSFDPRVVPPALLDLVRACQREVDVHLGSGAVLSGVHL